MRPGRHLLPVVLVCVVVSSLFLHAESPERRHVSHKKGDLPHAGKSAHSPAPGTADLQPTTETLTVALVGPQSANPKSSVEPPKTSGAWELMLLDPAPAGVGETGSTAVGDIDGDGKQEVVIGGTGAMLWYRPATFEKGLVANGHFHCGVALADIDGDRRMEIFAGHVVPGSKSEEWALYWYKPGKDLQEPFTEHLIDQLEGGPHDVLTADIDGDGKLEVVANAMYTETPGLFVYKPGADLTKPWKKQIVQTGLPVGHSRGRSRRKGPDGPGVRSLLVLSPGSGTAFRRGLAAA